MNEDPAAFKKHLDEFLEVCDRHGLRVMFALFDDCAFGSEEALKNPQYGKQPDVLIPPSRSRSALGITTND